MRCKIDWKYDGCEEITVELLKEIGVSVVFCDLDFTLAPRWKRRASEEVIWWMNEMLKNDIQVAIVSNNHFVGRVRRFAEDERLIKPLAYIHLADKPSRRCIDELLKVFQASVDEAVMIGNNERTDMKCAENAGIRGLRVKNRLH